MLIISGNEQTKKQFAQALVKLCERESFRTLSVRAICSECGLSTRTFYNNFSNKYDLVTFLIYDQIRSIFYKTFAIHEDWAEFSTACYKNLLSHRSYFRNIERNCLGPESLAPVIADVVVWVFQEYFENTYGPDYLDETEKFGFRYLNIAASFCLIDQLHSDYPIDSETFTKYFANNALLHPRIASRKPSS